MKDQKKLLIKCLGNEIPAFVICGTDICALETLQHYYQVALRNECNPAFLEDLKLMIEDFKQFQEEEPDKVKRPD